MSLILLKRKRNCEFINDLTQELELNELKLNKRKNHNYISNIEIINKQVRTIYQILDLKRKQYFNNNKQIQQNKFVKINWNEFIGRKRKYNEYNKYNNRHNNDYKKVNSNNKTYNNTNTNSKKFNSNSNRETNIIIVNNPKPTLIKRVNTSGIDYEKSKNTFIERTEFNKNITEFKKEVNLKKMDIWSF